jgi:pimeloyl-ACP methyl ester carboxylesterase
MDNGKWFPAIAGQWACACGSHPGIEEIESIVHLKRPETTFTTRIPSRFGRKTTALDRLILLVSLSVSASVTTAALGSNPAAAANSSSVAAGIRSIAVGIGSPPLRATLTLPAHARHVPAIVLVSGSGPNDQNETVGPDKPFRDLADGLAADGIATLRYDKRTRDYPEDIDVATFTPTEEYVPDAVAAINLLRRHSGIDPQRIFVLGHSQGGTFAPLIARTDPSVAGVILMAAAAQPFGPELLRQVTYLATLPGAIGAGARAELAETEQAAQEVQYPELARESPTAPLVPILGGTEPAYWKNLAAYNEVATARDIPQPLLFLQGDRDYQVTVKNDLDVWLKGLIGRHHVTVDRFENADHLFIAGAGPPSPADYDKPSHVIPAVISDIAHWVKAQPPR